MKLAIASDLHLDAGVELDDAFFENTENAEALLLAGDICESRNQMAYGQFFERVCAAYPRVFVVCGNHEHYWSSLDTTREQMRNRFAGRENLFFLENEGAELDYDTVIFGATLWTDCNKGDPLSMFAVRQFMNDFRLIRVGERMLYPLDCVQMHEETLRAMTEFVETNADKNVVILTHHAPSPNSINERWRDRYHENSAFASDLRVFMFNHANVRLWAHGHTHDEFDYEEGGCRVVCNPHGYPRERRFSTPYTPKFVNVCKTS